MDKQEKYRRYLDLCQKLRIVACSFHSFNDKIQKESERKIAELEQSCPKN